MALCARQTLTELRRDLDFANFFAEHAADTRRLEEQLMIAAILRVRLTETDDPTMAEFLDWFEKWFLRRAVPVEKEPHA